MGGGENLSHTRDDKGDRARGRGETCNFRGKVLKEFCHHVPSGNRGSDL